jgi:hypothetical protein
MDLTSNEKRLLWALRDMVGQHCIESSNGEQLTYDSPLPVFSGFIRANAEAIRILGEFGLVVVEGDNEDRVISGLMAPPTQTGMILKSGIFHHPVVKMDITESS